MSMPSSYDVIAGNWRIGRLYQKQPHGARTNLYYIAELRNLCFLNIWQDIIKKLKDFN